MSRTLLVLYAGTHLVSALLASFLGYWALTRTEMRSKRWFGALMVGLFLWSLTATAELLVSGPLSQSALKVLYLAVGLTVPLLWVSFTADYTYRSARTNRVVWVFAAVCLLLLVTVLTNPIHEYYASFTFHRTPFSHTELVTGPARVPGIVYILSSMGVGTYYLGSLFDRGLSPVSTPTAILAGAVLLGVLPLLGSVFGFLPVETYDHTPFGISVFLLGVSYVVFLYDFYNLSPVARDIVLDEANDAMFVLDSESRLVDHNTAATTITPDLTADRIGTPFSELHAELAGVVGELHGDQKREITLPVDSDVRHFSAQASDITVNSERIGTVVVLREITELRQRERQLERQNERLEHFASMVSHDLRNPLTVAQLRADLVARESNDDNVEAVQDALKRMETMIEDMLSLARAGVDIEATEQYRLAELVESAWATVPTGDSELEVRSDDATIEADQSRLIQVFENLFRNALEHNEIPITVRVGQLGPDEGFYVEDDGGGIPDVDRDGIFTQGYTTSGTGNGLGLTIVSDIVQAHGWSITATDSEAGGARFEIRTG